MREKERTNIKPEMIKYLRVFTCKHCRGNFVVVEAKNTLIPVNCNKNDKFDVVAEYDPKAMVSHLKTCKARKKDWPYLVKHYKRNRNKLIKIDYGIS